MLDREEVLTTNCRAWNNMAERAHPFAQPVKDSQLKNPLATVDATAWLPNGIKGWNVLCLAAGGGKHGALYAACGATVTVLDLSPAMLELDRRVASDKGLHLRLVEGSMDNLSMFQTGEFQLVIHPVSTCYLPNIQRIFEEIARVTKPDGLYISQHKQPINLQSSLQTFTGRYVLESPYCSQQPVPVPMRPSMLREDGTLEFVHTWNSILGGICRSGFAIEDVSEPQHGNIDAEPGSFAHRSAFIPPYIRIKAKRISNDKPQILLA